MCVLCYGLTGEEHWSDARVGAEGITSLRARRRALLTRVMAANGLDYSDDPTGVTSRVSDRKGQIKVVRGLGETWAAAQELATHPLDPMDRRLLKSLESERPLA
jgi:hypothetical protein